MMENTKKIFNEEKFMELLRNPSILDSGVIQVKVEGVVPKKEE